MSEFLVAYLDAIDVSLLQYLDQHQELRLDTAKRLRFYVGALLDGSITPAAVAEDWGDFYDLVPAFVATYAPRQMEELEEEAAFLDGPEIGDDTPLTDADRVYLVALERMLGTYPEMRLAEGE